VFEGRIAEHDRKAARLVLQRYLERGGLGVALRVGGGKALEAGLPGAYRMGAVLRLGHRGAVVEADAEGGRPEVAAAVKGYSSGSVS
jgi:hypothetical protein